MSEGIRFGVSLRDAPSGDQWVALGRRIESLGYAAISMADHLTPQFAPLAGLGALAAATSRVRIGTTVLANDFRNPVVLAKEAATLDVLSGGRLDLGIGAGWLAAEYGYAGLPFERPGVRIARLAEAITVIKRLFAGGEVTFRGEFYEVNGYTLTPAPVQRPRPRIMLGGGGPRVLSLAAREADIVSISTNNRNRTATGPGDNSNATLGEVQKAVRRVNEAAPERMGALELNIRVLLVQVGGRREDVATAVSPVFGLAAEELGQSPFCAVGTVGEVADHFRRLRGELGISSFTISGRDAEALAPIIELLA